MRVLHILHSMNRGGAENAIMNYYRNMDREKVQFDFLLTTTDKCDFEDEIIALGGRIYRIPLLVMTNPFPYLKAIKAFFLAHPEYRIVHSHTSSKSTFPLWVAKNCGIPVRISHSHGSRSEKGINGKIRDFLKIPLKRVATHWFACGNDAAIWLYGKKALEAGKVKIIRNVIESARFTFNPDTRKAYRAKLGVDDQTCLLGLTARFHPVKNHSFALDVLKSLLQKGKNVKLLFVGDGGGIKQEVIAKAKEIGVYDHLILAGIVTNVNDYLQAMDIYLMPSINEGLPLSLVEAQIASLSCVVSTGVPHESDITGLVKFLPLSSGADYWAEEILKVEFGKRESQMTHIKEAGYDAVTSARLLQEFYLNA